MTSIQANGSITKPPAARRVPTRPAGQVPLAEPQRAPAGDHERVPFGERARALVTNRAREVVEALLDSADIKVNGSRPWDIRVHDERMFQRVLADGTLGFGEAYMDGWWDCEAIDELCYRAQRAHAVERIPANVRSLLALAAARLLNLQTVTRARRAIPAHYDLGNSFFASMLGPSMQYSCAYFDGTDDLGAAQRAKMDLICRKLGLKGGQRLLDIGCGWGGLAQFAAERYGCSVVGITLSPEQRAHAERRCRALTVEIRLQDYREVTGEFDHVVSVGMMEHVGYKNYRQYMEVAARCLRPGGLFLCHTIARNDSSVVPDAWMDKYIFPGGMVPSVAQVGSALERLFVLEDVQNLGPHYDQTLLAWERNFARAWPRLCQRYGTRFGRMWRFYLLSCAGAFRARDLQLFQFVLAKGGVPGGYVSVR